MTNDISRHILNYLKKEYGNPKTELRFVNLYELAVSVILSAQTTDKQVNAVTPELFKRYRSFADLSQAHQTEVAALVRSTGFYQNKAKNIINLAKRVTGELNGRLPDTREELMKLPGIGRKSANVILAAGFHKPALAVDTHVLRVANRIGYVRSTIPFEVEKALTSFIPREEWSAAHLLFIKHGRITCKARNPRCTECAIISLCDFEYKNL